MSTQNDAAIQAIRDRLTPSSGPMAQSPMSDYNSDPVTRNDLLENLNNWLVDDPDFIYGQLANEAGAEDTPAFRAAVDTGLNTEWASSRDDAWARADVDLMQPDGVADEDTIEYAADEAEAGPWQPDPWGIDDYPQHTDNEAVR